MAFKIKNKNVVTCYYLRKNTKNIFLMIKCIKIIILN